MTVAKTRSTTRMWTIGLLSLAVLLPACKGKKKPTKPSQAIAAPDPTIPHTGVADATSGDPAKAPLAPAPGIPVSAQQPTRPIAAAKPMPRPALTEADLQRLPKLVVRRVFGRCETDAEYHKRLRIQQLARRGRPSAFGRKGIKRRAPRRPQPESKPLASPRRVAMARAAEKKAITGLLGSGGASGFGGGRVGGGEGGAVIGGGSIGLGSGGVETKRTRSRKKRPGKLKDGASKRDLVAKAFGKAGLDALDANKNAAQAKAESEPAPDRPAEPAGGVAALQEGDEDEAAARSQGWGGATYLSNDDTMSLSSAQRVLYAIDRFMPLPLQHIRPHEMLNYFSFHTAPVAAGKDFSVRGELAPKSDETNTHTLALAVAGRAMTPDTRRRANLAFVIDRSGSMRSDDRMTYLKRGLTKALDQLTEGDIVHLVLFDNRVCNAVENFVVGRDDRRQLQRAIDGLRPRGGTNLHLGLTRGYDVADKAWQPEYTNRVVLITDALTNSGVTNERMIATIGKFYDKHRIRLSGVGVGRSFNDRLLDRLTERGKGAYVFLGSEAEVDAVFGSRFTSLIETTAIDVHFRLKLPMSLRMKVFYGEEASTVKADVQAIHYFANTSQLFLQDLESRGRTLSPSEKITLDVEYTDPETAEKRKESFPMTVQALRKAEANVRKGRLVMRFVDGLAEIAARTGSGRRHYREHGWLDDEAWRLCKAGEKDLEKLSEGLGRDREVRRVKMLWDKFCLRYEEPRGANQDRPLVRPRQFAPPPDKWPGAGGR